MIHKIWDKDPSGSDDEGSLRDNLIKSYHEIYFQPNHDPRRSENEIITNNLIGVVKLNEVNNINIF